MHYIIPMTWYHSKVLHIINDIIHDIMFPFQYTDPWHSLQGSRALHALSQLEHGHPDRIQLVRPVQLILLTFAGGSALCTAERCRWNLQPVHADDVPGSLPKADQLICLVVVSCVFAQLIDLINDWIQSPVIHIETTLSLPDKISLTTSIKPVISYTISLICIWYLMCFCVSYHTHSFQDNSVHGPDVLDLRGINVQNNGFWNCSRAHSSSKINWHHHSIPYST